jgi:DNA-binding NarL/FixJ family response regulator
MHDTERLEQGRRAFDRRAWADAYEHLTAGGPDEPDDLERLATAAYLSGHDEDSTTVWARAHQCWLDRDRRDAAVRCAFWLGFGLLQRGQAAQGSGWLGRARTLIEQHPLDCVEQGYLLLPEALMAMGGGDCQAALDGFLRASALARRFDDADLAALGAIGRGEALVRLGRSSEGVRLFDEAMVSVTAGETSPVVSGIVYCAVIDACQHAFDLRRAREWTAALDRWCASQPGLVPYRGQCLVHRAQVMQGEGRWDGALSEAQRACELLADAAHPAIGMAHYEVGELHRLRGRYADAEAAFRQAHANGHLPHPGLALLRLAEGKTAAAVAAIDRALDEAGDQKTRARLLPAAVEIRLAAGRVGDARSSADALTALAAGGAELLGAKAACADGAVLLAEGDPRAAIGPLRAAMRAWLDAEVPYEAARARLLLAEACRTLGDPDGAALERDAAREVLSRLGAAPDLARLDGGSHHSVTARELEVLRLVAGGRTNREIAEELVISERTVERHLGNIFTKLGVPNRAAATAYAYDRGLV